MNGRNNKKPVTETVFHRSTSGVSPERYELTLADGSKVTLCTNDFTQIAEPEPNYLHLFRVYGVLVTDVVGVGADAVCQECGKPNDALLKKP